ncbi:MAG: RraA family protein [Acidimicrobiales bacterium]
MSTERAPGNTDVQRNTEVQRLARLDTCVISDALDALGLPPAVNGIGPIWRCGRAGGRAVTVALEPIEEADPPPARHLGTAAVEAASAGDIIVVDNGGRTEAAGWGGLLGLAAHLAGVGAVVVDGACRDVDEMEQLGLPVFARAATARTARRRIGEVATNVPVSLGCVPVHPGDLVVADSSGVVIVPSERAEEVLRNAERLVAEEAAMAEQIRAGVRPGEVMGRRYETILLRGRRS